MPEAGFIWTEDRVSTLRRMWCDGASSGLISRTLGGVSRNAVMGKVNRLGLMGAGGRVEAPAPRAAHATPAPRRAAVRSPAPAVAPAQASAPRSVRDLVAAALAGGHPAVRAAAPASQVAKAPAKPLPAPGTVTAKDAVSKTGVAVPPNAEPAPGTAAATGSKKRAGAQARSPRPAPAAPEPIPAPEPVLALFSWETPRDDGRPTILGLRAESCRWPIGDPAKPGFHFCGETASDPRPYCAEHCAVAYQARDPNRPKVVWSPMRIAKARQATLARLRQGPRRSGVARAGA